MSEPANFRPQQLAEDGDTGLLGGSMHRITGLLDLLRSVERQRKARASLQLDAPGCEHLSPECVQVHLRELCDVHQACLTRNTSPKRGYIFEWGRIALQLPPPSSRIEVLVVLVVVVVVIVVVVVVVVVVLVL